jgi:putative transposase
MCTLKRRVHFTDASIVDAVRCELLRTANDYRVEIVAYCFMPDHVHVLIEGIAADSDLLKFIRMFRQRSGRRFRKQFGRYLWQEGFFDRFVRSEEATRTVVAYIVANPLRAGLCSDVRDYPFVGSGRFTLGELFDALP